MVTQKMIAEKAGVSIITVSRVLNTPDKVKPETRILVERILKEYQYTPNQIAQSLVSNKTSIIDVYIPEYIALDNPFAMYFIAGISDALSSQLYSFSILRNLNREHNCDGYIVTGLLSNEFVPVWEYAKSRNRPMALFGHVALPGVDCIDVDNVIGACEITERLLEAGHRDIVMLNVTEEKDYVHDRQMGFYRAFENKSLIGEGKAIGDRSDIEVVQCSNSSGSAFYATKELLNRRQPTAIFCATDTIAIGVVQAIYEKGLSVPEDVSVAGFDGLGHHLLTQPQITTVRQPIYEIGKMLAEALLARISGKEESFKNVLLKPQIIEGKSIGAATHGTGVKGNAD
ncbi:MAG: LacI family transcriptional regulator [Lachnospiraceae bacterium]|jgi:LacI family transcriptional regulator|nr:LacI family transcriptional regulator [Lachnospiraceae bacterium]